MSASDVTLTCTEVTSISSNAFIGKDDLKHIFITSHKLNSLPADMFRNIEFLMKLKMTNGLLKTLPAGLFDNMTRLNLIDFSYNQIVDIYCEISIYSLKTFNLAGNKLTTMSELAFAPLLQYSANINMTSNSLKCDCTMAWILDVTRSKSGVISDDICPKDAVIDGKVKCIFVNMVCGRLTPAIDAIKSECTKKGSIYSILNL